MGRVLILSFLLIMCESMEILEGVVSPTPYQHPLILKEGYRTVLYIDRDGGQVVAYYHRDLHIEPGTRVKLYGKYIKVKTKNRRGRSVEERQFVAHRVVIED